MTKALYYVYKYGIRILLKQRTKMLKKILFRLLIVSALPVLGFFWFLTIVPSAPENDLRQTDAIIVLTGGSERLKAGMDLLMNGYAPEMFVSGVGRGVAVEDLFPMDNLPDEKKLLLKQRIFLGYGAVDTRENGIEVARWVKKRGYRSVRLVTSNYHTPRSIKELSLHLQEVAILTFPVFPESVKTTQWWVYPGTTGLLISEYVKYLAVLARSIF